MLFADLLSLHLVTFSMFFILVCFSTTIMVEHNSPRPNPEDIDSLLSLSWHILTYKSHPYG